MSRRRKIPAYLVVRLVWQVCVLVLGVVDLIFFRDALSVTMQWVFGIGVVCIAFFLRQTIATCLRYRQRFMVFLEGREVGYMAFTDRDLLMPALERRLMEYFPCPVRPQEFKGVGGVGYLKDFSKKKGRVSPELFLAAEIVRQRNKEVLHLFLVDLKKRRFLVSGWSAEYDEIENPDEAILTAVRSMKYYWSA